jgi:hypothetical protein
MIKFINDKYVLCVEINLSKKIIHKLRIGIIKQTNIFKIPFRLIKNKICLYGMARYNQVNILKFSIAKVKEVINEN